MKNSTSYSYADGITVRKAQQVIFTYYYFKKQKCHNSETFFQPIRKLGNRFRGGIIMLTGFYSALIIFTLLFIIAAFFFIRQFVNKQVSPSNLNTIMLGVLTLFMLIVSGIYSYDFFICKQVIKELLEGFAKLPL